MSLNPTPTNASHSVGLAGGESKKGNNAEEIPFLVTHWLANYGAFGTDGRQGPEHKEAMKKIREATSELASAFASIGAYGTSFQPSLGSSSFLQQSKPKNTTFADVNRRWSGLAPSHLENLVRATATNSAVVDNAAANSSHINLLSATGETREGRNIDGRTLQDAIDIDSTSSQASQSKTISSVSALHTPVLISSQQKAKDSKKMEMTNSDRSISSLPKIELNSTYEGIAKHASNSMRQFLALREKVRSSRLEIKTLEAAILKQKENSRALDDRFQRVSTDTTLSPADKLQRLDNIKGEKQVSGRVITQLQRKIAELKLVQDRDEPELVQLEAQMKSWDCERKSFCQNFRDPFESRGMGRNRLLQTIIGRQHGISASRPTIQPPIQADSSATRKNLICSRLSHAATINAHLSYPVYCLRFDRTGRYFITGADDYLIKVFYLGAGQSCRNKNRLDGSRQLRCNYGANLRGAVLVCSLRGHAGVINDIDVSADNCFLATASVDGDVRVWGLKDGCPVAVLRGHKGGANMVSWSTLTPYRLVSTGSDGYARQWDVREACLKRYGRMTGKREEYRLRLTASEKIVDEAERIRRNNNIFQASAENLLPPLPVREGAAPPAAAPAPPVQPAPGRANAPAPSRVIVPPLPAGVAPLPGQNANASAPQNGDANNIQAPGQFVANDLIDEGVKLLGKFKHGATGEDNAGPGTRSRRTAVKVICVARSPIGGHFTTGSDDGICRVWPDSEESRVEVVDCRKLETSFSRSNPPRPQRATRSEDEPLLQLMGHVSAITDLSYSNSGDRILSASQKEGVVRIWSLNSKLAELASTGTRVDERGIGQTVIRLTNPCATKQTQKATRRRPGHSSQTEATKVNCDVAVWSHDDSRVLTSQSVLVKQNGTDIQPGSQFLFLWDSLTGRCLMGISGAHAMQCPVVVPHPNDSSLVCTAGADGFAKVWDWESGRCVFTHQNKVEFGPTSEASSERNKVAGYLDGAFNHDGTTIVLTDDDGRITILDCAATSPSEAVESTEFPAWMKEQYFASDYYELFYDQTGYCIERGSNRPPHLAPRGVRCNHSGSPWSEEVNEAFARGRLVGPIPLPEQTCRWRRNQIREKARNMIKNIAASLASRSGSGAVMIRRGIREFDPKTTIMIRGSSHDDKKYGSDGATSTAQNVAETQAAATSATNGSSRSNNASRDLSTNWQWRDFDDLIRDQGNPEEEEDSDDEEFAPSARRSSGRRLNETDDDDMMDEDDDLGEDFDSEEDDDSPARSTRRRNNNPGSAGRRQRAQRRAAQRTDPFVELGSDDEGLVEFMSLNNAPKGPYVRDYNMTGHYWRLSGSRRVKRGWLSRMESDSSYEGRRTYTPQLGDSIVYIPRAHYEILQEYPSLSPPWQRWPQSAAWPVVRCLVRGIRFRFPYEDYYRKGRIPCNSVVAILTLEITGIPELSEDRDFPWPKPSFIEPTRQYVFELSLFDTSVEFVFPEAQYVGRLETLERVATRTRSRMDLDGVEVTVNYSQEGDDREFQAYPATLEGLIEEEVYHHDANLRGSGYGTVKATSQGYSELLSPWELLTAQTSKPSRPRLSEEEKTIVMDNIKIQLRKSEVNEYFSREVDQSRYSDYWSMVEIEMFLLLIKRRVEENYYGSKLSVVGDVRLIRDNCIKYNDVQNELSAIATEMCSEFETNVLSTEELSFIITEEEYTRLVDISAQTPERNALRVQLRMPTRSNTEVNERVASEDAGYGLRDRTRRQTSLERLAQPEPVSPRRRSLRAAIEASLPRARNSRSRSQDAVPETETLGRVSRRRASARRNYQDADSSDGLDDSDSEDERKPAALPRPRRGKRGDRNEDVDSPVSRRTSSRRITAEDEENDEEEYEAAGRQTRLSRSAASAGRRSRSTKQFSGSSEEEEEDDEEASFHEESDAESEESDAASEDDDEEEEEPIITPKKRARPSPNQRQPVRASPRGRRKTNLSVSEQEPQVDSPSRRSSRAAAKKHSPYFEVESDYDINEESDDAEEEEEHVVKPSPRGRARRAASYNVPSSDEDNDNSFDDGDTSGRRASRSSKKRSASRSKSEENPRIKRKRTDNSTELPQLNEWPDIQLKEISDVANGILEEILKLDLDETFVVPVLELYPDMKRDYLMIVKKPMDLRTIEEERLQQYMQIKELQEDLILMFENCCKFNSAGSDLYEYTVKIWSELNTIFVAVCKKLDVMLPRRWRL